VLCMLENGAAGMINHDEEEAAEKKSCNNSSEMGLLAFVNNVLHLA